MTLNILYHIDLLLLLSNVFTFEKKYYNSTSNTVVNTCSLRWENWGILIVHVIIFHVQQTLISNIQFISFAYCQACSRITKCTN